MPWTLSHPAAILPFRQLCPRYLHLTALVAGSLTPDLGYYIERYELSDLAHTWPGIPLVCIPSGLLLLALFYLVRRPLWFLLPEPHRSALAPVIAAPNRWSFTGALRAMVSIALGAATHLIWDGFTHAGGWVVGRLEFLRHPWVHVAGIDIRGYTVLQHASTIAGVLLLGVAYRHWLRQQPRRSGDGGSDRWRYLCVLGIGTASLAVAIPYAFDDASAIRGHHAFSTFVVQVAIYGVSVCALLLLLYSVAYRLVRAKV